MACVSPALAFPSVGARRTSSPTTSVAATRIPLARSIIDQNRVWHATDRHRPDRFPSCRVHDREVVAEPIGNVEGHLVRAESDTPRTASNQHVGLDLL